MSLTIAISDVHGSFYTLTRLLNQCAKLYPGAKLVFLGDLIDRGPNSRAVVEFAMENTIPTCAGNHESLCLAYSAHTRRGYRTPIASYYERDIWLYNGGNDCLGNWPKEHANGYRDGEEMPKEVLDWMQALPPYIVLDTLDDKGRKCLASHTGYALEADSGTPQGWFGALWGRHEEGDGPFPDDGLFRVYGHTQQNQVLITNTYANIDGGAAYASRGYGTLTAFIWPTKAVVQQAFDETPIAPRFTIAHGCIMG